MCQRKCRCVNLSVDDARPNSAAVSSPALVPPTVLGSPHPSAYHTPKTFYIQAAPSFPFCLCSMFVQHVCSHALLFLHDASAPASLRSSVHWCRHVSLFPMDDHASPSILFGYVAFTSSGPPTCLSQHSPCTELILFSTLLAQHSFTDSSGYTNTLSQCVRS